MAALGAFLLLTWLLAAVPFGLVVATLWGPGVDLRDEGSGNTGATNVLRVAGWRLGALAMVLDLVKGLVPVLLARLLWPDSTASWWTVVGLTAFAGHCWPVYLEFRGWKGVATSGGVVLATSPWVGLFGLFVWAVVVAVTGRSSVASLSSAVALVVAAALFHTDILVLVSLLGLGVVINHISNIRRLVRGEEAAVLAPVRPGRAVPLTADEALAQGPGGEGAKADGF